MANQDLLFDISKADLNQINQQVIIGRVGDGGLKAPYKTCQHMGQKAAYMLPFVHPHSRPMSALICFCQYPDGQFSHLKFQLALQVS